MNRLSSAEVWQKLVDEAGEEEIERAASVSVAEAERQLEAAGFDVAAERTRADAIIRELEGPVDPARSNGAGAAPQRR